MLIGFLFVTARCQAGIGTLYKGQLRPGAVCFGIKDYPAGGARDSQPQAPVARSVGRPRRESHHRVERQIKSQPGR